MPIEGQKGCIVYSGSIIKRRETTGKVIATGANNYFGKTIELVQTANTQSHIKNIIFTIILDVTMHIWQKEHYHSL